MNGSVRIYTPIHVIMMNNKDLESKRPTLFLLGVISALSLTLMAFEWRTPEKIYSITGSLEGETLIFETVLPDIVIEPYKPKQFTSQSQAARQSNSNILKVVPDDMPIMKRGPAMELLQLNTSERLSDRGLDRTVNRDLAATKSIRALQPHELPYMRLCGHINDDIERFQCTQMELKKYVVSNFRMPSKDQIKNLPKRVEVTFTIDRYGMITNVTPDKDYHSSLSSELERLMTNIPEMVPATVSGDRIAVRFELPIVLERY